MEPRYGLLDADVAREKARVRLDCLPRLLGGHSRNRKVARLSEDMRGQVHGFLLLHKLAHVAAQAPLLLPGPVAPHWFLEDVPADDEECVEEVGI